jgi:hypothetical protein
MSKVRKGIVVVVTAAVCAVVPVAMGEASASAATTSPARVGRPVSHGHGDPVQPQGFGSTWQ